MSAFREEDTHLFFGREEFVQQLVTAVKKHPLVPVIGASGSGKSSVVFAGLIPPLRAEGTWLIESFRPQSQPFYGLASALVRLLKPELDEIQQPGRAAELADEMNQDRLMISQVVASILERNPGKRILLVIDQFEELYSLCRDEKERQRFLDRLLSAVEAALVQRTPTFTFVFTLRADFYGYVLSYRRLVNALGKSTLPPLGPMSPQELQATIEKPVENLVELESGLTERILEDVAAEPGNLPLLEFALTRLWEETQKQGKLTHAAYLLMGGVKQALANHADTIYNELRPVEQQQAQRIFVQGEFVGVGVFSGTTSGTTGVVVGLGVALGDADVATVVVSLQPTNSPINNPGIAKFSFMFKIYLYLCIASIPTVRQSHQDVLHR